MSAMARSRAHPMVSCCVRHASVLALAVPLVVHGQRAASRVLSPDAVFAMRPLVFGSRVVMSPDGRYVAYTALDPQATTPDSALITMPDGWRMQSTGAPQAMGRVWVIDLVTQREVAITGETGHSWAPVWSPTGSELAMLSDRDGRAGLWIWRPEGAALRRVGTELVSDAYYGWVRWTPDGRRVLVGSPPVADIERALAGKTVTRSDTHAADSPFVEVRRAGLSAGAPAPGSESSGAGDIGLRTAPTEIVSIDVATGERTIVARDGDIEWFAPSPDGQWLAYAALRAYSLPQGQQYQGYFGLFVVPLAGGTPRKLADTVPLIFFGKDIIHWAPDSKSLVYRTVGLAAQQGLYRVAISEAATAPQRLTPFVPLPEGAPNHGQGIVWDSAGRTLVGWSGPVLWRYDAATGAGREVARLAGHGILCVLTQGPSGTLYQSRARSKQGAVVVVATDDSGMTTGFYRIDLASGAVAPLYEAPKQVGFHSAFMAENSTVVSAKGDRVVFAAESASEPPELWTTDAEFHHPVRRASHLSGAVLDVPLGQRRIVQWTTPQGQVRRGILLLPADYHAGVRYPLIVWMYEKSIPHYVNTFGLAGQAFFNLQLFATRGYAGFYPDLRWTKDSVLPSLGEQVHDGVRELARLGIADSTRVGIVGQSSGGYDVLAVATAYPGAGLRAGVAVSGVADMVMAFGGTMDDPVGYEWVQRQMGLGAPPWEHPERYILNSPSYHFDRVHAPLLLLQGTADDFNRPQTDLAFAELKRLGKPVEYRRYPGEGHVPDEWVPANRLDAERRMLDWFDTYVRTSTP